MILHTRAKKEKRRRRRAFLDPHMTGFFSIVLFIIAKKPFQDLHFSEVRTIKSPVPEDLHAHTITKVIFSLCPEQ